MRIAVLLIFLALGSHAKAAEPIPQKKIPADKSFTIKTKYVLITMPTIRFENFDKFNVGRESLQIFPAVSLSRNDVDIVTLPDQLQSLVILKKPITYRQMKLQKGCHFLMTCPNMDKSNPVRVLETVSCAKGEIQLYGVSLTASFADHRGAEKGEFGANFDIIVRSKLVTEDGRILHPGNVIRLIDFYNYRPTNEVELVSEKPYGPIAPDGF